MRTREVGRRIVAAAHELGVRRLAMEALPSPADGVLEPVEQLEPVDVGYLAQPEMRALITAALELGRSLWPYEQYFDPTQPHDPDELSSLAFTNRRERTQATNLCAVRAMAPDEPLLVWCGNGHAAKEVIEEWIPMGHHFRELSGVEAFVIDQAPSCNWPGGGPSWPLDVLAALQDDLVQHGGTAGLLREQVPASISDAVLADAVILSTANEFT